MIDESRSFWTSLPGILTGLETGVTSVTGLFIAINGGMPKADDQGGRESGRHVSRIRLLDPPPASWRARI